jgi:murein DD-endopeptidase MepM/ murein hydrolase activator NlpD
VENTPDRQGSFEDIKIHNTAAPIERYLHYRVDLGKSEIWFQVAGLHPGIDHGGGYVSIYAHLNSFTVKEKQQVEQGQLIGYTDNTGFSTGPLG